MVVTAKMAHHSVDKGRFGVIGLRERHPDSVRSVPCHCSHTRNNACRVDATTEKSYYWHIRSQPRPNAIEKKLADALHRVLPRAAENAVIGCSLCSGLQVPEARARACPRRPSKVRAARKLRHAFEDGVGLAHSSKPQIACDSLRANPS